jgi:ech hydrogenase subunit E
MHEISRIHSHLLWLGLCADAFGFENLFMHSWRLREQILDIFEKTTGGRVILSYCNVGGVNRDVENGVLAGIIEVLDKLLSEYDDLVRTFLKDRSVVSRLKGVGHLTTEEARDLSVVGPFARATNIPEDLRSWGTGFYGELSNFEPIVSDAGDCYGRVEVRIKEVPQSIAIIKEVAAKIPDGEVKVKVKGSPEDGKSAIGRLEQPRGECIYYTKGNGSKFLDRFRIRTPTNQNIAGLVKILQGCDLADVPINILTIDPCISCTER